ncbi:oligosaccharide flippase family protein [Polaromonas sp.]|uniref:oligosaccharide flippase family protein n=1 Tax=Polaromonas sp. TaxID=1869339 RepID=UPI0017FE0FF9|nr:oligosaccharide flippase family protein [Polaromonas sp.]NML84127.1 oligosaccharide flippase family protein [Polaromonas sp.]
MSLKRNTLWNLAGSTVPLVAGAALIPFTLGRLGNEAFGVLTLIWGLIGYFSLFDLGVGRALTYQLSQLSAAGRAAEIGPTLRAGMVLTLAAGLLGAGVVWVLAPGLAQHWLKISPALQHDSMQAFLIAALGVLPTTLASGLRGALEGLDRFSASNISRIALGLWMFMVPAWSVYIHGPDLWVITFYLVLGRCLVVLGMGLQLRSELFSKGAVLEKRHLGGLWNYGFWITVTGVVGPLMVYGDRFFVSAAVGAEQLPLYAIPQEGLLRLLLIPMALTGALLPRLAAMGQQEAASSYRQSYRRVMLSMLGVCLLAAALAYPVLAVWLSAEFARAALPVVLVLCAGVWINSMALLPYTLLHARGNPRLTAIFHLFELLFYFFLLWFLSSWLGLLGAALAWAARVLLDLVLLRLAARRLYGV